jgi:hypothetical protein
VYVSGGGIYCDTRKTGGNVWQRCADDNSSYIFASFEATKNEEYIVEQPSWPWLPAACVGSLGQLAYPATEYDDIVCNVSFTLSPGDSIRATWYEPSHSLSLADNGGSITVDLYGWDPSAAAASAIGDPHLQNIHGQRFDLKKEGKHVLINIPRGMSAENALLRVQADTRLLGGHCADMYFLTMNVTGAWAEQKHAGGYHYHSEGAVNKTPEWVALGPVQLKVVPGHTKQGIQYLNLYVKSLGRAGLAVGGLLGDDDHSDAATAPAACGRRVALTGMDDHGFSESSTAVASF